MIFNLQPRQIKRGINVPISSHQASLRVAPDTQILEGQIVYYGPVNFGDSIVPNYVQAIYPPGYTARAYDATMRYCGLAAESASTSGQSFPSVFCVCYMPEDMPT